MINKTPVSFEFFPPQTQEGLTKLTATARQLSALRPEYFSVTFGAGGSTRERTLEAVQQLRSDGFDAAPHLSCVGSTRDNIRGILDTYRQLGIKRIVALRGDLPSGMASAGEFHYANELVSFIRAETGDEFHPQCKSPRDDLLNFSRKAEAGANAAITQYFYNSDAYFRFLDDARKLGISLPIVPGIMPIVKFSQLARFSDACGAEIPRWMRKKLESFGDDSAAVQSFGLDVVTQLCEKLLAGGAPGLHFYTLNQAGATTEILKRLGRQHP
jgi:methylenetetrahydrofolate reductase (NADPH)